MLTMKCYFLSMFRTKVRIILKSVTHLLSWNNIGRVNEQVQHEVKLQQKSKELILRSRKFQFFPWPAVDLQLD